MSHILVSGSIAYDYIMNFDDQFGKYILPDKTHSLSVNFNIQELRYHDGGAGHNIAFNLALLGEKSLLMWAVWSEYEAPEWNRDAIDWTYTHVSQGLRTPSAHIITDAWNNQITAFYPGASIESGQTSVDAIEEDVLIAIVSPHAPTTMLKHLQECHVAGIPVVFDPGQPLSAFSKEQIHEALTYCNALVVNEYEYELLYTMAEMSPEEVNSLAETVIITRGKHGAKMIWADGVVEVPALHVEKVVDPTGAGDAFRAGLLWSWKHGPHVGHFTKEGMELWTKLAALCIQKHGTQEHTIENKDTFIG